MKNKIYIRNETLGRKLRIDKSIIVALAEKGKGTPLTPDELRFSFAQARATDEFSGFGEANGAILSDAEAKTVAWIEESQGGRKLKAVEIRPALELARSIGFLGCA